MLSRVTTVDSHAFVRLDFAGLVEAQNASWTMSSASLTLPSMR